MKKVIVISLGGSLIIPDKINEKFLESFKKTIEKNKKNYSFVVVCGGGKTARNYIGGLENQIIQNRDYFQSLLGIASTRLNARFMAYFFGEDANETLPNSMKEIKNLLKKNEIVFCGALRYSKNETSDATASKLANYFNSEFINLTDVPGLFDKNPKKYKNTEFIHEISHKEFLKMAKKISFKPGQHFVLDQKSARLIKKYNVKTYIIGTDMKNLDNILNKKHFVGTIIG